MKACTLLVILCCVVNSQENLQLDYSSLLLQDKQEYCTSVKNDWDECNKTNATDLDKFIKKFPTAPQAFIALRLRSELLALTHSIPEHNKCITVYKDRIVSQQKIADVFKLYQRQNCITGYIEFINNYPNTLQALLAEQYIYSHMFKLFYSFSKKEDEFKDKDKEEKQKALEQEYELLVQQKKQYEQFLQLLPNAPQTMAIREILKKLYIRQEDILLEKKKKQITNFNVFQNWKKQRSNNIFQLWEQKVSRFKQSISPLDLYQAESLYATLSSIYPNTAEEKLQKHPLKKYMFDHLEQVKITLKNDYREIVSSMEKELTKNVICTIEKLIEQKARNVIQQDDLKKYKNFVSLFPGSLQNLNLRKAAIKEAKKAEEKEKNLPVKGFNSSISAASGKINLRQSFLQKVFKYKRAKQKEAVLNEKSEFCREMATKVLDLDFTNREIKELKKKYNNLMGSVGHERRKKNYSSSFKELDKEKTIISNACKKLSDDIKTRGSIVDKLAEPLIILLRELRDAKRLHALDILLSHQDSIREAGLEEKRNNHINFLKYHRKIHNLMFLNFSLQNFQQEKQQYNDLVKNVDESERYLIGYAVVWIRKVDKLLGKQNLLTNTAYKKAQKLENVYRILFTSDSQIREIKETYSYLKKIIANSSSNRAQAKQTKQTKQAQTQTQTQQTKIPYKTVLERIYLKRFNHFYNEFTKNVKDNVHEYKTLTEIYNAYGVVASLDLYKNYNYVDGSEADEDVSVWIKYAQKTLDEKLQKLALKTLDRFDFLVTKWHSTVNEISAARVPSISDVIEAEMLLARINYYQCLFSNKEQFVFYLNRNNNYDDMLFLIAKYNKHIHRNYSNLHQNFKDKIPIIIGSDSNLQNLLREVKDSIHKLGKSFISVNNIILDGQDVVIVTDEELENLSHLVQEYHQKLQKLYNSFEQKVFGKNGEQFNLDDLQIQSTKENSKTEGNSNKTKNSTTKLKKALENSKKSLDSDLKDLYICFEKQPADKIHVEILHNMVKDFRKMTSLERAKFLVAKNILNISQKKHTTNAYLQIYHLQLQLLKAKTISINCSPLQAGFVSVDQVFWERKSKLKQRIEQFVQKIYANNDFQNSINIEHDFQPMISYEIDHIALGISANDNVITYLNDVSIVEKESALLENGFRFAKIPCSIATVWIAAQYIK